MSLSALLWGALACACGSKANSTGGADNASEVTGVSAALSWLPDEAAARPDADSLYAFTEAQVKLGPRVPGTEAHKACRELLIAELTRMGVDTVSVQTVPVTFHDGKHATAYNIMGSINPSANDRVLLLAHYDTRPTADEDPYAANHSRPIDGANDGASGVAVLLETARVLAQHPAGNLGVDLLFVDAEDSGETGGDESTWCLGSQEWAKNPPYTNENRPAFGILLDMVGGADARFPREYISDRYARSVNDKVWSTAAAAGYSDRFPNSTGGSIIDDHIYINRAGIPCIDIIESANPQTGSFNPTWHTMDDNLSNIDRNTLRAVADVVIATLRRQSSEN